MGVKHARSELRSVSPLTIRSLIHSSPGSLNQLPLHPASLRLNLWWPFVLLPIYHCAYQEAAGRNEPMCCPDQKPMGQSKSMFETQFCTGLENVDKPLYVKATGQLGIKSSKIMAKVKPQCLKAKCDELPSKQ